MSKFQELQNSKELLNKERIMFEEGLQKRLDTIHKQREKLEKEFNKKVRKLFCRVKIELIVNDSKLVIELNGKEVFKFTYDTFTFRNIDKELAVELQYLYLEYYGEPQETSSFETYRQNIEDWVITYVRGLIG